MLQTLPELIQFLLVSFECCDYFRRVISFLANNLIPDFFTTQVQLLKANLNSLFVSLKFILPLCNVVWNAKITEFFSSIFENVRAKLNYIDILAQFFEMFIALKLL